MSSEEQVQAVSLHELHYIFRRRWKLIAATTVVLTSASVALGLSQPQLYKASAKVLVQDQQARVIEAQSVVDSLPTDEPMLETHVNILRSRDHGLRVIRAMQLTEDPEFQPSVGRVDSITQALHNVINHALEDLPGYFWVATGLADQPALEGEQPATEAPRPLTMIESGEVELGGTAQQQREPAQEFAFDQFERRLSVMQDGKSYLLTVSFTSSDPKKAAAVANKVVELYLDLMERRKKETTLAASHWLLDRLEQLRSEYLAAQDRVQQFRKSNNIVTTTGVELNERQLGDLHSELVKVRAAKSERLAKLQLVRSLKQRGIGLDTTAEVIDSQLITRLREEQILLSRKEAELRQAFGARHPKIIELQAERAQLEDRVAGEINRIIATLQSDMDVMSAREANLELEVDRAKNASSRVGLLTVQLSDLERQAEAARRLYDSLLQRFEETKQQVDLVKPDATLISRAAPPTQPDKISGKFFLLVGLVASALTGGFLAVVADRLSTTVRSGNELAKAMGVPCLSLVPRVGSRWSAKRRRILLGERPRSVFAEAIRSIVVTLQLTPALERGRSVTVTSAFSGEGKTSIAASLAVALAQQGARVLLVDLDLHRGALEHLLLRRHLAPVEEDPGLGYTVLHHVPTKLDVALLKGQVANPAMFLASTRLKTYLSQAALVYEWVIIDSPPALGLNDARLIARASDFTLIVAKWNDTRREAVQVTANDLREYGAKIIGGVMNFVDLNKLQLHGHGLMDREGYYRKNARYYTEKA